jgi:DNA-binding protein HU-beta
MNKSDIIRAIAAKLDISISLAAKSLEAFIEVIEETVESGDKLSIPGIISLDVKKVPAKTGRNPKDGSVIKIAAKNKVVIKVGKRIKDIANPVKKKK